MPAVSPPSARRCSALARGIAPAALVEEGLAAALDEIALRMPIPVIVETSGERWAEPLERTIYYAACEAITNAVKHAAATQIAVGVRHGGGTVILTVTDDGGGGASPSAESGLAGLIDRVQAVGGRVDLLSPAGRGPR